MNKLLDKNISRIFYFNISKLKSQDPPKTASSAAASTTMLALADDFRTLRWEEVFKYPEVILEQMKELLPNA